MFIVGPTCGAVQCRYNEECCMTCGDQGQLVPADRCASTLNAPGCPQPFCVAPPGMWYCMTINLLDTFNKS